MRGQVLLSTLLKPLSTTILRVDLQDRLAQLSRLAEVLPDHGVLDAVHQCCNSLDPTLFRLRGESLRFANCEFFTASTVHLIR